jgi:Na+-translocating ferredoxin:NAD+ oxidoreductase RnfD subunit
MLNQEKARNNSILHSLTTLMIVPNLTHRCDDLIQFLNAIFLFLLRHIHYVIPINFFSTFTFTFLGCSESELILVVIFFLLCHSGHSMGISGRDIGLSHQIKQK